MPKLDLNRGIVFLKPNQGMVVRCNSATPVSLAALSDIRDLSAEFD